MSIAADKSLWQSFTHPALSLEAAAARLREKEESHQVTLEPGHVVIRVDSLQLESGSPCEDFTSYHELEVGQQGESGREEAVKWHFWGIFDGHAGWACAATLNKALAHYVAHELRHLPAITKASDEDIDSAIKKAFLRLDDEIISSALEAITNESESHAAILSHLAPAVSGSCALLAILDPSTRTLRVACVGDSRAVLGRRQADSNNDEWTAISLSEDQTPANANERSRITSAHPEEPKLFDDRTGRMIGIPLTRAFGDHRWKWPVSATAKGCPRYYANPPRPNTLTPPYLTAEPVIRRTHVVDGDMLILASDGVWDNISSAHAVSCVGRWVSDASARSASSSSSPLPLSNAHDAPSTVVAGRGKPMSPMAESWGWEWTPDDLVVEDGNAATHLAKNALGGNRREQFCSVMSTRPPESKDARDDITARVLFFGGV